MPAAIPDHKVEEVRQATDVVDLVSGYLTLKKRGKNFFGLCPFHNEKTPSFSVNPEKQIFHCFGCGVGGNVFTFIMRHEGTNFVDAVKFLGQGAGIEISFEKIDETQSKENENLYHINEFAAQLFQETLFSTAGEGALKYLKKRGLSEETIRDYGLGYAPDSWDFLAKRAKETANDLKLLEAAGLIVKRGEGGVYDRFRDRIMFPIWNLSGRVIAFGGRKFKENIDSPKYVNSPETSIYEKSKVLYGLYQNRDSIRKETKAIFVEGYMDLLSLVARGVSNVVATSGTSLTEMQARLILRYTRGVVLLYDSDSAGMSAALRGANVLLESGIEVHIASLPAGHDPDSFIVENGNEALIEIIEHATNMFDFKIKLIEEQVPEKRSDDIRSLLESLSFLKDKIRRNLLLSQFAEKMELSERVLWDELEFMIRQRETGRARRARKADQLSELTQISKTIKIEQAVEDLIKILLHDWTTAEFVFNNLDFEHVQQTRMFSILDYLKNQYKGDSFPPGTDLIHHFTEIEHSSFISSTFNENWQNVDFQRWASDCIATIKKETIQRQIDVIREQIRLGPGFNQSVSELLQLCQQLEYQKQQVNMPSLPVDA